MIEETLKRGSKIQGVGVRSLDEPMNLGLVLVAHPQSNALLYIEIAFP